jgi:hypothetical protein
MHTYLLQGWLLLQWQRLADAGLQATKVRSYRPQAPLHHVSWQPMLCCLLFWRCCDRHDRPMDKLQCCAHAGLGYHMHTCVVAAHESHISGLVWRCKRSQEPRHHPSTPVCNHTSHILQWRCVQPVHPPHSLFTPRMGASLTCKLPRYGCNQDTKFHPATFMRGAHTHKGTPTTHHSHVREIVLWPAQLQGLQLTVNVPRAT